MTRARRWYPVAGLVLLLALFAVRLADTATRNSFTADEPHYVGTGLYLWETGDYHYARVLRLHPPLAFHVASLPWLVLDRGPLPVDEEIGRRLVHGEGPAPETVRIASRLPFALLALWGAWLVFAWAREIAGDAAGLLATFLYTTSPMLLAHGALAHSDITVSVLVLQTLYAAWRALERPGWLRLALCGASLGLAMLAKLSALVILSPLPLLFGLRAAGWLGPAAPVGETPAGRARWALVACAVVGAAALPVFWLGYGGSFVAEPVESGPLAGTVLPGYLHAFLVDNVINAAGRETYFLGEFATRGWWYYFPVAFLLKAPVGVLLLLGAALVALRGRPSPLGRFLLSPFAVYLAVGCFWLDVPLGLRYMLPLYAPLFVFTATQLAPFTGSVRRALVAVCCVWIAVAGIWVHPHYLAYFNEPAGGPAAGPRHLLDANVDWGQDLGTLAEWLAERGNPEIALAYFGPEKPERYGIRQRPLRGCRPVSGLVALSVNIREGLYHPNPFARPRRNCYAWLDGLEPVARPGWSIVVYDVPATR